MESKELARLNKRLHKIGNELADKAKSIESEVTQWLVIGANEIRNTIILSMRNTPKTGRHYKVSKTGKPHIASSPGNAPAIRSGDLIRSIIFDARPWEVEVGSILEGYPEYLEFGTKKMEPRPWLAPAVKKHEDEIVENVGKSVFEIIGKPFEGK